MSLAVLNELQNNQWMFKGIKIIALGDIALDRTFLCTKPRVEHATHGSETIVDVERDDLGSVGSVNCTSEFCVNMGADSLLISIIGHDEEGKIVQDVLAKNGIRNQLLEIEGIQTVTKIRFFLYDKNQGGYSLYFRADKETYEKLDLSYAKSETLIKRPDFQTWLVDELSTSDGLLINDTEKGFLSSSTLQYVAEMVRVANGRRIRNQRKPIVIVADPKRDWQKFKEFPIDFMIPNEDETMNQVGINKIDLGNDNGLIIVAKQLYQQYSNYFPKILITLGRHGSALLEADDKGAALHRYPAFNVPPSQYHVGTHCGDMFGAALVLTLAAGTDTHSAVTFANYVGSLQFGKLTGTKVTKDDILREDNLRHMRLNYHPQRLVTTILDKKNHVPNEVMMDESTQRALQQTRSKITIPSDSPENRTADVLLITVTELEAKAVLDLFPTAKVQFIGERTYHDLGTMGGARTLMIQSWMGTGGPGGSLFTVAEGIRAVSPSAVVMVGIAYGLYPRRQHIGDILISQQLLGYDLQRVGTSFDGKPRIYARGDRVPASVRLVDRFRAGKLKINFQDWPNPPRIEFGLVFSGSMLIDNLDVRDQLHAIAPEAIGGEMEGAGLYDAAHRYKVDWILVKAICDWADGKKHFKKEERQKLAAENAAGFVIQVIQQGGFVST